MAHCCPSSSFGTSRRGWLLVGAAKRVEENDEEEDEECEERAPWIEGSKVKKRRKGRGTGGTRRWKWRRSSREKKEVEEAEDGVEERIPRALSAVNVAHVVAHLLSSPSRNRPDRSTVSFVQPVDPGTPTDWYRRVPFLLRRLPASS
ncbi:hypothetical protein KM043_011650 [Ampulex compressa]|nr:hypothetical protein KM043_011650 [Ampulex compressa]